MKRIIFLGLIFLAIFNPATLNAQQRQYFYSDGFSIQCSCKLYQNEVYQQQAKYSNAKNNKENAYVCAVDEQDPYSCAIYNINVIDLSDAYKGKTDQEKQALEKTHLMKLKSSKEYMQKYALNSYKSSSFKGIPALETTMSVGVDISCKAIAFVKNKKFYLLMVTTRSNLGGCFLNFTNSFKFTN